MRRVCRVSCVSCAKGIPEKIGRMVRDVQRQCLSEPSRDISRSLVFVIAGSSAFCSCRITCTFMFSTSLTNSIAPRPHKASSGTPIRSSAVDSSYR